MTSDLDNLLRAAMAADKNNKAPTSCPSDEQLGGYLERRLTPGERQRMENHLAVCRRCRETLTAALAVGDAPATQPSAEVKPTAAGSPLKGLADLDHKLLQAEKRLGLEVAPREAAAGTQVMVVDDNRDYLDSLVDWLKEDYRVLACSSGQEALERFSAEVSTVVLDIKMPGMSGLDVAERLEERHRDYRLIFNTGHPGEFARHEIEKRYKPFAYVTKDQTRQLMACIQEATGTRPQRGLPL